MLELMKVAVTGGLSCGKSSACRFFKELGAFVVNADEIVHRLLTPHTPLGQQVIHLIGPQITVNGQIDRSKIAKKVFNQPELLKAYEGLVHPLVYQEMQQQYELAKQQKAPLFVAEVPLLFETQAEKFFNFTITIMADSDICRKRFTDTTLNKNEEYDKRMARQLDIKEKAKRADIVIINNDSLEQLREAITQIYQQLKK